MSDDPNVRVLDHGYVKLVEAWGSDESIIEAARMSTGKGFQGWGPIHAPGCKLHDDDGWNTATRANHERSFRERLQCTCTPKPGDEKLLKYLWDNKHETPFEMAGLRIEVQAPIFVFREWHRHRVFSVNEMSARYTPLPDLNYIPTLERLMFGVGASNKQAGTVMGVGGVMDEAMAVRFREGLQRLYAQNEDFYQTSLLHGVPKELARVHLPVGRYSRMQAQANLRNWLGFLRLRLANNAQWEIRQYANVVGELIREKFPRTWELFQRSFPGSPS